MISLALLLTSTLNVVFRSVPQTQNYSFSIAREFLLRYYRSIFVSLSKTNQYTIGKIYGVNLKLKMILSLVSYLVLSTLIPPISVDY